MPQQVIPLREHDEGREHYRELELIEPPPLPTSTNVPVQTTSRRAETTKHSRWLLLDILFLGRAPTGPEI